MTFKSIYIKSADFKLDELTKNITINNTSDIILEFLLRINQYVDDEDFTIDLIKKLQIVNE